MRPFLATAAQIHLNQGRYKTHIFVNAAVAAAHGPISTHRRSGSVGHSLGVAIHKFGEAPLPALKIWHRLQGLSVIAAKNAVYALPANTQEEVGCLLGTAHHAKPTTAHQHCRHHRLARHRYLAGPRLYPDHVGDAAVQHEQVRQVKTPAESNSPWVLLWRYARPE